MGSPQGEHYSHRYIRQYLINILLERHLLEVQPTGALSNPARAESCTGSVRGARVEWGAWLLLAYNRAINR